MLVESELEGSADAIVGGKGVKIGHLAQQCKGAGISSIKLEELIDALKHEGRIYEPRNGVLMPTEGGK